jgi:hypothetical protein
MARARIAAHSIMIAGGVKKQMSASTVSDKRRVRRQLFAVVDDDELLGEVVPIEGAEEVDTPVPDFMVPKYLSSVLYQICEAWSWVNGAGNEEAMNAWPMFEQLKPMPGKPGRSIKVRTKLPLVLGRISAKMDKHGNPNPNLGRWYFGRRNEETHVRVSVGKSREYVKFQQWLDEST